MLLSRAFSSLPHARYVRTPATDIPQHKHHGSHKACPRHPCVAAQAQRPQQPAMQHSGGGRISQGSAEPTGVLYKEGEFVNIGEIVGAHGIKGEVKVELATDDPKDRLGQSGRRLYLRPPVPQGLLASRTQTDQPMIQVTVLHSKIRVLPKGAEAWLIKFAEVADRTQAEGLRGHTIVMHADERAPSKDPDEFYVQDLFGCSVYLLDDASYVGHVVDVFDGTGTHDTLVIQLKTSADDIMQSRTRTCMMPFVKDICPQVDAAAKRMFITPPEGLLEIVSNKKMKPTLTEAQKAAKLQELKAKEAQQQQEQPQVAAAAAVAVAAVAAAQASRRQPAAQQRQPSAAAPIKKDDNEDDGQEEEEEEEQQQQPKAPSLHRQKQQAQRTPRRRQALRFRSKSNQSAEPKAGGQTSSSQERSETQ